MNTVLITGGSSGIGYELSQYFAKANYRILWVSKPLEELEEAAKRFGTDFPKIELNFLQKDLAVESSAKEVLEWVQSHQWTVNVLVNNAGFGTYGYLSATNQDKEIAMLNLHVLTVYQLSRIFLEQMMKRNQGSIINISSISALQPIPRMNTYASSKAFVKHFSLGLAEELKLQKSNIHVMTVCPAAIVNTAFKEVDGMHKVKTFSGLVSTTVEEVAKDIWKGFQKKQTLLITGAKARWLYTFKWLVPRALERYLINQETETE